MRNERIWTLLAILAFIVVILLTPHTDGALADDSAEMVPSFTYISIQRASNGFVVQPVDTHGYEDIYTCADIAETQAAVEALLLQIRPKKEWEK